MRSSIVAATLVLIVALFSPSAFAQRAAPASGEDPRMAEVIAAWQAAEQSSRSGPTDVALINQATLKLPASFKFIPKAEAARIMRANGNTVSEPNFIGLVVGSQENDQWIVVINYVKDGYIKDDDAKNWSADDLLKSLTEGTEETNKDRAARGFPELKVLGWVQPPAYDSTSHRLVWSMLAQRKGAPGDEPKTINYNTYALGRDGYFGLNLISTSDRIAEEKAAAHELLANLVYNNGKRYEDFSVSTDRVAAYGLAALVGGVVAKKVGLLALVAAFALKFVKVIVLGVLAVGAGIVKLFRRRKPDGAA